MKNMTQRQPLFALFAALFLLMGLVALAYPRLAHSQDATIPTRTPTPDPNAITPTSPPPTPGGGLDPTAAPPTNTPAPAAPSNTPAPAATLPPTATASAGATLAAPPLTGSGATATAAAAVPGPTTGEPVNALPFPPGSQAYAPAGVCGEPPTVQALALVNVHQGPGLDYPILSTLQRNEVKPIVGRAAFAPWWLIQLDAAGQFGWVADAQVRVEGNSANVRAVAPPPLNGSTPTPGAPWAPTPNPQCILTPSPTATEGARSAAQVNISATPDGGAAAVIGSEAAPPAPTAVPLEPATGGSAANLLLPIFGLLLIVAAIFVALFQRRRQTDD
jgi:LPXTG-motif cell wall-anchored protein